MVVVTEEGEFFGVFKSLSVSIVWLFGLPGITGSGKVDSVGVESSLRAGLCCMPHWAATVSVKEAVTRFPELSTRFTKGRECCL